MKFKQKKGVVDWWIIVGAVIALVMGAVLLSIYTTNLFGEGKNLQLLQSCKTLGGQCQPKPCAPNEKESEIGCSFDENRNGKIDDNEKSGYCCISQKEIR